MVKSDCCHASRTFSVAWRRSKIAELSELTSLDYLVHRTMYCFECSNFLWVCWKPWFPELCLLSLMGCITLHILGLISKVSIFMV